jgi:hypothetical protein
MSSPIRLASHRPFFSLALSVALTAFGAGCLAPTGSDEVLGGQDKQTVSTSDVGATNGSQEDAGQDDAGNATVNATGDSTGNAGNSHSSGGGGGGGETVPGNGDVPPPKMQ